MLKNPKTPIILGFVTFIGLLLYLLFVIPNINPNIPLFFGYFFYLFIPLSIIGIILSLYYLRLDEKNRSVQTALWLNTSLPLSVIIYMLAYVL